MVTRVGVPRKWINSVERAQKRRVPAPHGARQVRKDAKITARAVPDAELQDLFDECDADGGATICLAEFTALLGGDPVRRTAPRICQP